MASGIHAGICGCGGKRSCRQEVLLERLFQAAHGGKYFRQNID